MHPAGGFIPTKVVTGTGRTILRTQSAALCRCGGSANKPYCDGSHNKIGFAAEAA
jgi:CDGSH-type Zn-finger protein